MDYNRHLQLSFKTVELYEHIEDELLRMVAKRLKRTGAAFAFEEQEGENSRLSKALFFKATKRAMDDNLDMFGMSRSDQSFEEQE